MNEEWKPIIIEKDGVMYDYSGLYEVSNMGRVRSLNYRKTGEVKVLKLRVSKNGYQDILLHKNGKTKRYKVHRLVGFAFVPNDNPTEKTLINHIDENKQNNVWTNLEWCTKKYNTKYSGYKISEAKKGEKNPFYGKKHSDETKKKIGKVHKGKTVSEETRKKMSEAKKGKGKKVICLETEQVFDTVKDATEWCKGNVVVFLKGKTKYAGKHPITGEKLHWMYYDEWLAMANSNN